MKIALEHISVCHPVPTHVEVDTSVLIGFAEDLSAKGVNVPTKYFPHDPGRDLKPKFFAGNKPFNVVMDEPIAPFVELWIWPDRTAKITWLKINRDEIFATAKFKL